MADSTTTSGPAGRPAGQAPPPPPQRQPAESGTGPVDPAVPSRRRPVIWLVETLRSAAPGVGDRMSRLAVRGGYRLVNHSMRQLQRNCLNYGWAPTDPSAEPHPIEPEYEADRYGLQLYWRVAADEDLSTRSVLEVGCGRGSGSAFLARSLNARTITAVDLTASSIKWCRENWTGTGIDFRVGNAEDLAFPDASFDALVNVESSHNYPHVDRFLAEAFRVLRPGGALLLADLRPAPDMPALRDGMAAAGFTVEVEEDITPNVVAALEADAASRRLWVESRFPRVLRKAALEFAGGPGTSIHESLKQRSWVYHRFVARKPGGPPGQACASS